MSTPVVLVPGAPVLVPELSGAAAADTIQLVGDALRFLSAAAEDASRVLVIGSDPGGRTAGDTRSSLHRWGAAVPVGGAGAPGSTDTELPDTALMGWWFLDRAGITLPRSFVGVGVGVGVKGDGEGDGPASRLTNPLGGIAVPGSGTLVVVVADGPASLTPRAPVPEDPRGVALDAALTGWLRHGGPLPDPGADIATSVGWWSRPAWRELARLVGDRPSRDSASSAPFGVGYHCARWDSSSSSSDTGRSGGER